MSGIGEASLVLGIISSIITIIDATKQVYKAVEDEASLPTNFQKSATKLPLISRLLKDAEIYVGNVADESIKAALTPTLENCKSQAAQLQQLFEKVMPEKGGSRLNRYWRASRTIGKSGRVESLVAGILDDLQLLATRFPDVTTSEKKDQLAMAIEEVTKMKPSLPDWFEQTPAYANYGSGTQSITTGGGTQHNNNSTGHQYNGINHIVNNHKNVTVEDIDQSCLRVLRCPDTLAVKNRLKENKDKLLLKCIDWILQDEQYISWKNKNDICLLWIKGGAGKGKTMISIGLIEQLSLPQDESTVVTYFFCQNADYELKTLEAIIKGLILQLVNQQKDLKESLRRRWNTINERFDEDVTSWRILWNIFLEMLDRCKCQKLYVVVDALDECQDNEIADFLKLIVRTGFIYPSKIKWLLTSRPLDSAEQELLAGSDQVLVSLELNSKQVAEAVATYIADKVVELDRRRRYGASLRQKIETELTEKAEDTYLWVSLVCKRLESVHRDMALTTIQDLPPGLHPLYHRMFDQLSKGESAIVNRCMRLLKVMMLVYRPLNMMEVGSVSGLSDEWVAIEALVDRCASFVKMRGITDVEFVHQSVRDYLAGNNGQTILDAYQYYGHGEIALNCLSYLSQQLKVNLINLPRPDSTRELTKGNKLMTSVAYAATFWVQHVEAAKQTPLIQEALAEQGEVSSFLCTKLLEWLECLSLLNQLPRAIEALTILTGTADSKNTFLSRLVQDAARFLLRHYQAIVTWPLQIYSSAIVFSPESSIIRRKNLDKRPAWLRKLPQMEDSWASLVQTLEGGHLGSVSTIAFSPDSKQIASGSNDGTICLWDVITGDLQKTIECHSGSVSTVAFSPDSKQIASGSIEGKIKLWDATTGKLQKSFGHYEWLSTVVFSPDGKQIASGSESFSTISYSPDGKQIVKEFDKAVKLWDAITGDLQKTIECHSGSGSTVAFSPDGKQIASGSDNQTIKLWDTTTGDLQNTLKGHSRSVLAVVFSPDGKQIASGSDDETVRLWDAITGDLQKTIECHSGSVSTVAFSPDGKQIASGSDDQTIKLWDTTTGNLQNTLKGHSRSVLAVVFSPDGKQIVSGSDDETIKLWDVITSDLQKMPKSHSGWVRTVAFSPDGKQIASGSDDQTIKLWDTATGALQTTLKGHIETVRSVVFSPDGKQIASGSDDETIRLWDAITGDLQKTLRGHFGWVSTVAFSPDSKQIASGSGLFLRITYSPKGKRIESKSGDGTIKLWDAITGSLQKTFSGHSEWISTIAFSPDGKQIASGSKDGTIKLWDVAKALKISRILGSRVGSRCQSRKWLEIKTPQNVNSLKFSTDGLHLATNLGVIKIKSTIDLQSPKFELSKGLQIRKQWICYGETPIFLLPSDFLQLCHDVKGDEVTIGFSNGRVLRFNIDCALLA